jgi:hypothetical protein
MAMVNQIDDYVKRPARYRNIAGLAELMLGLLITLFWPLDMIREIAPSGFRRYPIAFIIYAVAISAAIIYGWRLLRARIVYPRTGYVKDRAAGAAWMGGVVGGAVAYGISSWLPRFWPHFPPEEWWLLLSSAVWGLVFALMTRKDAAWRWIVLIALVAAPLAIATLPLSPPLFRTLPLLAQGVIFSLSGAIALTLYLHRNPRPEQVKE